MQESLQGEREVPNVLFLLALNSFAMGVQNVASIDFRQKYKIPEFMLFFSLKFTYLLVPKLISEIFSGTCYGCRSFFLVNMNTSFCSFVG